MVIYVKSMSLNFKEILQEEGGLEKVRKRTKADGRSAVSG